MEENLLEDTETVYQLLPSGRWGVSLEISLEILLAFVKPVKEDFVKQKDIYTEVNDKIQYLLFWGHFIYSTSGL